MGSTAAEAYEREMLLDRLTNLRTIVPVLAEELASARRQLAGMRRENRLLQERLGALEEGRADGPLTRSAPTPRSGRKARTRVPDQRSRALAVNAS